MTDEKRIEWSGILGDMNLVNVSRGRGWKCPFQASKNSSGQKEVRKIVKATQQFIRLVIISYVSLG